MYFVRWQQIANVAEILYILDESNRVFWKEEVVLLCAVAVFSYF